MKKLNIEVLIKIMILAGYSLFSYNLIRTGKIKLYVHPRINLFVIFGVFVMSATSLILLREVKSEYKKKIKISKYLIYIMPLAMAFSINAKALDSSVLSNKSVDIEKSISSTYGSTQNQNISITENRKLDVEGNTIILNDENFVFSLNELNNNIEKYKNKEIKITGFIYKDKQFKGNEFVIGRFMMVCCTADMQLVGLMCHYENAGDLKNDTWVTVTGKIEKALIQGQLSAGIKAESIKKIDKPDKQYVYPY